MKLRQFQDLLDRLGADLSRWPPSKREAGQSLLDRSGEARNALVQARKMAALFATQPVPEAPAAEELVERATRLPQVRTAFEEETRFGGFGLGWRYATVFASCLVVGIGLGLASISVSTSTPTSTPTSQDVAAATDVVDSAVTGAANE